MKIKQATKVLKSNLELLVLLRESLAASGAQGTPLFAAVVAQAQLTGSILPDQHRMTKEQVQTIRRQAMAATIPEEELKGSPSQIITDPSGIIKPSLPAAGQMMILKPEQLRPKV